MLSLKGFGRTRYREMRRFLQVRGYDFKGERPA